MHSAEIPQSEICVSFPPLNVPADWPPQPDPDYKEPKLSWMERSPWLVMALFLVGTLLLAWFVLRVLESFPPLPRLLGSLSLPFVCILSIYVPAYWIFAGHERIRESYRYITEPIEEQLNARPIVCSWRGDSVEDGVLVALSDAVGLEKCVPHSPALHPKDSLRYLLWGAFDDITPLVFRTNFDKRFKCDPVAAVLEGVEKDWNVEEFVAACIHLIADKTVSLRASQPTD